MKSRDDLICRIEKERKSGVEKKKLIQNRKHERRGREKRNKKGGPPFSTLKKIK